MILMMTCRNLPRFTQITTSRHPARLRCHGDDTMTRRTGDTAGRRRESNISNSGSGICAHSKCSDWGPDTQWGGLGGE